MACSGSRPKPTALRSSTPASVFWTREAFAFSTNSPGEDAGVGRGRKPPVADLQQTSRRAATPSASPPSVADGAWSETPAELAMIVIPPWWRTPWALGLFGLLLGAGVYGFVRWRVWHLQQQNAELEALVAARTSQVEAQAEALREMDRVKSRFFANLSHEFPHAAHLDPRPPRRAARALRRERGRAASRAGPEPAPRDAPPGPTPASPDQPASRPIQARRGPDAAPNAPRRPRRLSSAADGLVLLARRDAEHHARFP